MNPRALFNGQEAGELAGSRGLHYGDGVFRTVLIDEGAPLDWQRQARKLEADALALHLRPPPGSLLQAEVLALVRGQGQAVLKIILARRATGRGYRPLSDDCDRLLLLGEVPRYDERNWTEGIEACRSALQLAEQPALAGLKHLNRLEQVLASRDWPAPVQEAILGDGHDRPVCGTRSNLFWVEHGVLVTPDLSRCGVAGAMRERVLELAASLNLETVVTDAPWASLLHAQEAFVTNSLIGIWPLRRLETRHWPEPGPLTMRLQAALRHPRLR